MNSCKCCGKEIGVKYTFCSKSCAAKYNNTHRTRKPWTEEQKQKISEKRQELRRKKELVEKNKEGKECRNHKKEGGEQSSLNRKEVVERCKYCGGPVVRGTVCKECLPYVQNLKAFRKLGIPEEGSLEERFRQMIEIIQSKYYVENKGLIRTAKELHLNQTTIRFALKKAGLCLRSISEGQKVAILEGRIVPPTSPSFRSGDHISWEGTKYHFRSSWEERYMKELDKQRIRYVYEFGWIKYWNSVDNCERLAKPDFYLPETNELVELKSSYTIRGAVQSLKDKFKRYKELGFKPKLILDWKEVDIDSLEE